MNHIFISYSRQDRDYARKLADSLLDAGFDVWIDDRIEYGDDWERVIFKAIDDCAAFVVVMSPASSESRWVQRERHYAEQRNKPPFPVLLVGEVFPFYITTQYFDGRGEVLPPADYFDRLAQSVPRQETRGEEVTSKPAPHTTPTPRPAEPESQERRLEAAMPACTRRGTESQVRVRISLPESEGLRAELPDILPTGDEIQKGDVRATTFSLQFPRDEHSGTLLPAALCVQVTARDFEVNVEGNSADGCGDEQIALTVLPQRDSRTVIFTLLPKSEQQSGLSRVMVRLYDNGQLIAENSVSTQIVQSFDEHPMCGMWRLSMMGTLPGAAGAPRMAEPQPAAAPPAPMPESAPPEDAEAKKMTGEPDLPPLKLEREAAPPPAPDYDDIAAEMPVGAAPPEALPGAAPSPQPAAPRQRAESTPPPRDAWGAPPKAGRSPLALIIGIVVILIIVVILLYLLGVLPPS
jgi:hypothetical protein